MSCNGLPQNGLGGPWTCTGDEEPLPKTNEIAAQAATDARASGDAVAKTVAAIALPSLTRSIKRIDQRVAPTSGAPKMGAREEAKLAQGRMKNLSASPDPTDGNKTSRWKCIERTS